MNRGTLIIFLVFVWFKSMAAYQPDPNVSWEHINNAPHLIQIYNASGVIEAETRLWSGSITPTTATGQAIDISSAGFTNIVCAHITAGSSTGLVMCQETARTNSSITINLYRPSSNFVTLLGEV